MLLSLPFVKYIWRLKQNILRNITKEIVRTFVSENKFDLHCTQPKLCVPIINRIYRKMLAGIRFREIKIVNSLICDGHHRYLASRLAKYEIETTLSSSTAATVAINWESVKFDKNDWDMPERIDLLNRQDADYNDIPIDRLTEMLE